MKSYLLLRFGVLGAFSLTAASALALDIRVKIENLSPTNGTFLTPMWFGVHNGSFDMFSAGTAASVGVERIAEDGNPAVLDGEFLGSGAGTVSGVLSGIGPIAPGAMTSDILTIDENAASSRYFSFMSMVIPSNDAFIGNDNARAHRLFSEAGTWIGADFIVLGTRVWDAGTEVNDEKPAHTAFLGQAAPNTGVTENGVVHFHPGFLPGGNILNAFPGADFTQQGYQVARVSVEAIPEPGTMALLAAAGCLFMRRRK